MHGTYVNDKKVPIDEDVEINTGDVLTFGNEVTRWPGMYPGNPHVSIDSYVDSYYRIDLMVDILSEHEHQRDPSNSTAYPETFPGKSFV